MRGISTVVPVRGTASQSRRCERDASASADAIRWREFRLIFLGFVSFRSSGVVDPVGKRTTIAREESVVDREPLTRSIVVIVSIVSDSFGLRETSDRASELLTMHFLKSQTNARLSRRAFAASTATESRSSSSARKSLTFRRWIRRSTSSPPISPSGSSCTSFESALN